MSAPGATARNAGRDNDHAMAPRVGQARGCDSEGGIDEEPLVSIDEIAEAAERIRTVIHATPMDRSESLSRVAGRRVLLKLEHLQRTGSFKIRGAYNKVSQLPPGQPVVAASAGNHAQGVALAAALTGRSATIFMPRGAPVPKWEATRDYGADVLIGGDTVDVCIERAEEYAARTGALVVPPFDDRLIIAGQGTLGLEIAEEAPEAETVVVAVGGGGLISGVAVAMAARRPGVRIIGVEAAGAPKMRASMLAGQCVRLDHLATMADGIAIRSVVPRTLRHVKALVDDVVTVTEEEISRALLLLIERAKAVVEPAAATTFAAILAGKVPGTGPVVSLLSGGNVDPVLLIKILDHGLSAAGRYVALKVLLHDRPGSLAALSAEIAGLGLNVLSVEHHRFGLGLGLEQVEVHMTLETRNAVHRDEILSVLRSAGFVVELAAVGR